MITGKSSNKFRVNPCKSWYQNLEAVTTSGDDEATLHLKRPQTSFIALLASGWSPVYPCHVSARDMRAHPIGTGPFKFVEFKPNESVKVVRNSDYWKPGRKGRVFATQRNFAAGGSTRSRRSAPSISSKSSRRTS